MFSSHGFVVKAKRKHRAASAGKRGEQGRFITLKSGRVIFIPAGKRTKWADVRDRVLASQKRTAIRERKLDAEGSAASDLGREHLSNWLTDETNERWVKGGLGVSYARGGLTWQHANERTRAAFKAQVAKELSEATGIPEGKVSEFVEQWAKSSNDADMRSLAIQRDAAEEFGLEMSDFTKQRIENVRGVLREQARVAAYKLTSGQVDRRFLPLSEPPAERMSLQEAEEHVMDYWRADDSFYSLMDSADQRKLLRAMYDKTQAELAARGIKEVRLYRGVGFDDDPKDWYYRMGAVEVETNVLESWSVGRGVASDFAVRAAERTAAVGIRFETTVPAKRILSSPVTGFGCLTEGEVLVLGGVGGDTAEIGQVYEPREPWAEEEEELWAGEDY